MKRVVVSLLLTAGALHAQLLVNDFSTAPVPWSQFLGTTFTTSGLSGQVDAGYFTINDARPNNDSYRLIAYSSSTLFNISGVTGFNISLRRENANTAAYAELWLLDGNDNEHSASFGLSSLSTSSFTNVYIPISSLGLSAGVGLMDISIRGDMQTGTGLDTYNFSVDSIRAVPEPSAFSLLPLGLSGLIAFRRRQTA